MDHFKGNTAVITGAASGIGLALARRAAAEGMNLVLADIDSDALDKAAATLQIEPGHLLTRRVDVSNAEEIKRLADAAYDRFGAVHLLCNNAGVAVNRVISELTVRDWEWVLGVNLWSVIHGIGAFLPRMQAAGVPAHIVNTASAAGLLSTPGLAAYNVSKHGVVTLSETLYHELELSQSPVGVSVLCPSWVPTGIGQSARNRPAEFGDAQQPGALSEALAQGIGKALASAHLTADDMADATFDAVRDGRFYVIPHHDIKAAISLRMNDILEARNPTPIATLHQ
jgi:NAD(P)-dependent dehydrogenase (short-subunit alcohol dehydrogenase family)